MKTIYNPDKKDWGTILARPTATVEAIEGTVTAIFEDIQKKGDKAIASYTEKFDHAKLATMKVSSREVAAAEVRVPHNLKTSIIKAKGNIEKFHNAQRTERITIETSPGVVCWQEKRAIQKVGLYIPGGTAPLFSTILMLALPAKIAGCTEIVLCTPPDNEGKINDTILYTAAICGVTQIFKVGGIQAIAGMTFGTETIPAVYKIFGPGNQYVTVAKQLATKYGVAIDMPAGPSELLVVADDIADPSFVASDLLSQAEHGIDSQVILVSTSKKLITAVQKEIQSQLKVLKRKAIAEKAIANSKLIYVADSTIAADLINQYGPEHYIICATDEAYYLNKIQNAGSVFIGNYTPESAGDYASGTNHTLPTNGYAKQYSGVNLDSFLKSMTFQKISKTGLLDIGETIEVMAAAEGLQAHKNAVTLRLERIKKEM